MSRLVRLLFVAVAIALCLAAATPPPVTLTIRIASGGAPFTTRARISIDPHPGNRDLCVQWSQIQGGGGFRRTCQPWVGETAPLTHWQTIKDLASGRWEVLAYIRRNDGRFYASSPIILHVLGPNYESEPEL